MDLQDDPSAEETFLKIFIDDTLLTLDDLTELLLALEGGGVHEEIEKLVAIFHRIKGSAAMVGLKRAAKLAHCTEDMLQNLLDSGSILSSELTDAVLKSSDALHEYVENLRGGIGLPDTLREAAAGPALRQPAGQPAAEWPRHTRRRIFPRANRRPDLESDAAATSAGSMARQTCRAGERPRARRNPARGNRAPRPAHGAGRAVDHPERPLP